MGSFANKCLFCIQLKLRSYGEALVMNNKSTNTDDESYRIGMAQSDFLTSLRVVRQRKTEAESFQRVHLMNL